MASIPEGDVDPQITFAAVGEALTAWEGVEESLSGLYTLLEHAPGDLEKYREYGEEGGRFGWRIGLVRKAATAYFIKHPSQDDEGDFAKLLSDAENASKARNQIAHGMVCETAHHGSDESGEWQEPKIRYHLRAPWFAEGRLKTSFPGMGSAEIRISTQSFRALEARAEALINRMHEP